MRHSFHISALSKVCPICGYDEISHTANAVCEACGLTAECDLFPNDKHPRKMLLCSECYSREIKLTPPNKPNVITSPIQIKTPGDYFNAEIPSIMKLKEVIDADSTIENKTYALALQVKDRLKQLSISLFDLDKQRATLANEQRDTLVYLNHLQKDLSAEKQRELGLKDLTYRKEEKAPKKITAPTIKKFDKVELKKLAGQHNIPEYVLQGIVTARKVTLIEAVKIYIELSTKVDNNAN